LLKLNTVLLFTVAKDHRIYLAVELQNYQTSRSTSPW
jgi:hypothetical protein